MIRVGIIGGAGYTAGELLRLLAVHPEAELAFVQSESHAGEELWKAHGDLMGETDMCFSGKADVMSADVVFLCGGHGSARSTIGTFPEGYGGGIIDLGNDFRLEADAGDFVYGLPEAFRSRIQGRKHIANPGCFATAIQLSLLPLAARDLLEEIHVTAVTGSTGAGAKLSETSHFSLRNDNMSVYKAFSHQHTAEICQTLHHLAPSWNGEFNFVPLRGDFARGIMASVYLLSSLTEEEAVGIYRQYYAEEPFVVVSTVNPDLKMVTNTNRCVLHVRKYGRYLHIVSMIDNLVKGASGQAIQNMNLMFSIPETTGLKLKGNRF